MELGSPKTARASTELWSYWKEMLGQVLPRRCVVVEQSDPRSTEVGSMAREHHASQRPCLLPAPSRNYSLFVIGNRGRELDGRGVAGSPADITPGRFAGSAHGVIWSTAKGTGGWATIAKLLGDKNRHEHGCLAVRQQLRWYRWVE